MDEDRYLECFCGLVKWPELFVIQPSAVDTRTNIDCPRVECALRAFHLSHGETCTLQGYGRHGDQAIWMVANGLREAVVEQRAQTRCCLRRFIVKEEERRWWDCLDLGPALFPAF